MTASNVGTSAYATRQRGLARLASDSCVDASPRTVRAFEFTMVADGFVLTCSETDCCFLGMLLRKITGVHSIECTPVILRSNMPRKQQSVSEQVNTKPSATIVNSNARTVLGEASTQESDASRARPRWRVAYALVPTLLAVITSLNSVWNHFASDDLEQVLNNALIKHLGNIGAAFTKSVWSFAGADIVFTVDPYF